MKILLLASWYPQHTGDHSGIFVRDQARVLARQHEVTVIAPRVFALRTMFRRKRASTPFPIVDNLREMFVPVFNPANRLDAWTFPIWARRLAAKARQVSGSARPDLVHAHVVRPAGDAAAQLSDLWACPTVLTEHSGPFTTHLQSHRRKRVTERALRSASAVVAVSPFLAEQIRSAFPEINPAVIGNVIDEDYFSPGGIEIARNPKRPFRFLCVSGLSWQKGVEFLVEAAALLRRLHADGWEIVVVGDGPERLRVEQRVRHESLTEQFRFIGWQPREQVRAWMRSADVVVQPSVIETFCVVLAEAMACGVPVIATHCGGPSWVVAKDSGRLVPSRDPAALAQEMRAFLCGNVAFDPQKTRASVVRRFGQCAWLSDTENLYAIAKSTHNTLVGSDASALSAHDKDLETL